MKSTRTRAQPRLTTAHRDLRGVSRFRAVPPWVRVLLPQYEWADGVDAPGAQSTAMEIVVAYIGYLAALCGSLGFMLHAARHR